MFYHCRKKNLSQSLVIFSFFYFIWLVFSIRIITPLNNGNNWQHPAVRSWPNRYKNKTKRMMELNEKLNSHQTNFSLKTFAQNKDIVRRTYYLYILVGFGSRAVGSFLSLVYLCETNCGCDMRFNVFEKVTILSHWTRCNKLYDITNKFSPSLLLYYYNEERKRKKNEGGMAPRSCTMHNGICLFGS